MKIVIHDYLIGRPVLQHQIIALPFQRRHRRRGYAVEQRHIRIPYRRVVVVDVVHT